MSATVANPHVKKKKKTLTNIINLKSYLKMSSWPAMSCMTVDNHIINLHIINFQPKLE